MKCTVMQFALLIHSMWHDIFCEGIISTLFGVVRTICDRQVILHTQSSKQAHVRNWSCAAKRSIRQRTPHQLHAAVVHINNKEDIMETTIASKEEDTENNNKMVHHRKPIDWQMLKQNLSEKGAYLLETGIWSDCTFIVGLPPNLKVSHNLNQWLPNFFCVFRF